MPDRTNNPDTVREPRATRAGRCIALALAIAFVACPLLAHAQTKTGRRTPAQSKRSAVQKRNDGGGNASKIEDANKAAKIVNGKKPAGGETVRERRAKSAPAVAAPEDETRVVSEGATGAEDEAAREPFAKDGAIEDGAASLSVEEELAGARAKIDEEKNDAERARLRRAYVERLVSLDRKPEAVAGLRAMVAEERFDPPYFYNAGNVLARLGESGAAADAYRKAISQRRGNYSRAQHNLGVVLTRQGRWEEAEEALKAALKLESYNYAEASYNLGRLYALRGEAGQAINEWARTLRLRPEHADAAVALARGLAEDGDPERALSILDAVSNRFERKGTSVPRAVEIARGEIIAARNLALVAEKSGAGEKESAAGGIKAGYREGTVTTWPLRPLAVDRETYDLLQRARTAREAGRNEEAVTLYSRVVRSRGGYFPPANLELGYALAGLKRNEEAVAALLPLAKREGTRYPIAFYHLGRYYESLGQFDRAGENFARAAGLFAGTNPQFLLDLSRVREKEGKIEEALAAMEDYARSTAALGGTPEWVPERVSKLRGKLAAAPITPVPSK